MEDSRAPGKSISLETDRLILRARRVSDAAVLRELWTERDPRVPPRRQIDSDGRPTIEDIEDQIRTSSRELNLLTVERKVFGDVIGYCGLIDTVRGSDGEPELAFEFLRRTWSQDTRPRPPGPSSIGHSHRDIDVFGLQSATGTERLVE